MVQQFWHNDITEKSFSFLQELKKNFNFILIGGWAVYFYTKKMKSKDIDIVVDYTELGKLKEKYNIHKNERLKKYEINVGEFDVDIYLPHYSQITPNLHNIFNYIQNIEGFNVPQIEYLLLLKLYAYSARQNSLKGEKDKIDIISILDSVNINWEKFSQIAHPQTKEILSQLTNILEQTKNVKEIGLNNQRMAKLKKKILINFNKNYD